MSATDTFEAFVVAQLRQPTPDVKQYLAEQHAYLLTLRSEDERQRFVERVIREVKAIAGKNA